MPTAKPGWLHQKLKLSHHRHSFKRLPHHHTSRGVLVVLVIITGALMLWSIKTVRVSADQLTGSGFLGLSGFVKPTVAATLGQPLNKQTFNDNEIKVNGGCPLNPPQNVVKIIDNGLTAGSAPCDDDGTYHLVINLLPGVNYLRARVTDIYGQAGPDSVAIKVFYYYPLIPHGLGEAGAFSFSSDSKYTATTGSKYDLVMAITGGYKPYAFSVNWGDGHTDVVSRADASDFTISHIYQTASLYTVLVDAGDAQSQKAHIETSVIVTGPGLAATTSQTPLKPTYIDSTLKVLVPVYSVTAFGAFAFWLGYTLNHIPLLKLHIRPRFRH